MAQWIDNMPVRTRVALGIGIAIIVIASAVLLWWALRTEQTVLFSRLNEGDAAGIVAELKKQKVGYQLADGGSTILVPADRVHDIRLALMSGGTPIAGGVGFEIFDRQGLGATEQSQRVSYLRALQGELARTIGALEGVQHARVHLVLPESTLFRRDREEARASVSLGLEPGVSLMREQIFGIQRLVAAAVSGLDIGRVVVTDQHGLTLSAADALTVGGATGEGRLSMKREVEEYVTRKVVALLDRAYGPGRAIVSVDATLNFDEVRRTVQDLLPPQGSTNVRRRRQTTGGTAVDPDTAFEASALEARGTTDTEYDYGRRVEQVVAAPGGVTRLAVGVIVPGNFDQPTQARIAELVRVAAGLDEQRGDQVVVQSVDGWSAVSALPHEETPAVEQAEPRAATPAVVAAVQAPWWTTWPAWVAAALLLGLLAMLALRGRGSAGRLSDDERAQLLADVRASLDRGPQRAGATGGAH
ncbi:MAG TPA: flagellar basal-body MS-ring/collar protein FliF [Burkholderiaceae bacterium]|nr:flagellar basal-body MS-ring/collar protein FliF [Burkholderiaceae bacterium]